MIKHPIRLHNTVTQPAFKYSHTDDLWIISCFFNSNSYKTKTDNFERFIERIETSKLNYLIIECAFGDQPFSLDKKRQVLQVRTSDIMWQKERLLNIALEALPIKCKKIAWVDCDILFENPDWATQTAEKLKHYKIVQPFKYAVRLPKDAINYSGTGDVAESFGSVYNHAPQLIEEGVFNRHGHTGYAWAADRSVFTGIGFYDVCIAGSADHMMAHSFIGNWNSKCLNIEILNNEQFLKHYFNWSKAIYRRTKGEISFVDGTLLHLWHGDHVNRNYIKRHEFLTEFDFNPLTDLKLNKQKCWEWNHNDPLFKNWIEDYFVSRKED